MKYKNIYWWFLSPMIKSSIEYSYGEKLAAEAIKNGKLEYRRLLCHAEPLGPRNPMAHNAYFAYVFIACWLGCNKKITPKNMAVIMSDVLYKLQPIFSLSDLNSRKGEKKWYKEMKKYEKWYEKRGYLFPTTWKVEFDEKLHVDGSYYEITRCPICTLCKKEGISEIMPYLCQTDEIMFKLQHGHLERKYTLAKGDAMCDYWIYGDKFENPK